MIPEDELVRWLFLDLNAYFASVEQELRPELRGKPIAVVPVMAETTCCIAASYEAKAYGIKTGMEVKKAKLLCPQIELVEGRQNLYVKFHHKILAAIEECIPVTRVESIDEVACRLMGRECRPENAVQLAKKIKQTIHEKVGETLHCSIGLAPNRFLGKAGCEMQKPNGLTLIRPSQLPQVLYCLKPRDLPGIGSRMQQRLESHGVYTMEQLCALTEDQMYSLWGSIIGKRFWRWLRGEDFEIERLPQQSVGHQHVLAPEFRTRELAGEVGRKLVYKAAVRLRQMQMWACGISVYVSFSPSREKYIWEAHTGIVASRDPFSLLERFRDLWRDCPAGKPTLIGVVLYDLIPDAQHTISFFAEEPKLSKLTQAMDNLNHKHGSETVYLASWQRVRKAAPTRIAFTSIPKVF